jgi:predicted PurR-regulated permease PerM
MPLTRDRLKTITLLILTGSGIVVCLLIAAPFTSALTWAVALAVVSNPVHDWIRSRIRRPDLAAGLAVSVITIGLLAPAVFIARAAANEGTQHFKRLQELAESGELKSTLEANRATAALVHWVETNIDVKAEVKEFSDSLQRRIGRWIRGTIWTLAQALITIFLLFYFFRDRRRAVNSLRSLLPLSETETDYVLERVRVMIHATIYGTLVVAAVQGALGGLMFWILGLPGPLLWGLAMGLLSIVPVLGAFVIWIPAVVGLAAQGSWVKAAVLTGWGTIIVGLIDNLLYPILVGKEMRLHTAPVFIAIVGGLFVFGASGLVLGPVFLALTLAFMEVLKRRTADGRSAQDPA